VVLSWGCNLRTTLAMVCCWLCDDPGLGDIGFLKVNLIRRHSQVRAKPRFISFDIPDLAVNAATILTLIIVSDL